MGNKNKSKEKVILIFTENKTGKLSITKHIPITIKKEKYALYPVNFPVMYLSLTEISLKSVVDIKANILPKLKYNNELLNNKPIDIFQNSNLIYCSISNFVVNAAICLESYCNTFIEKDSKISIKEQDFNWKAIQKSLSVKIKINELIDVKTKSSFKESYPVEWKQIDRLITLRNDIVHTKVELDNDSIFKYKKLINSMLNFDCELTFISLKNLIKFYTPSLLVES